MDASSESLVKHIIKTFIMKIPSGITVSKFKKMFQLNERTSMLQLVDKFQQVGKVENWKQVCSVLWPNAALCKRIGRCELKTQNELKTQYCFGDTFIAMTVKIPNHVKYSI